MYRPWQFRRKHSRKMLVAHFFERDPSLPKKMRVNSMSTCTCCQLVSSASRVSFQFNEFIFLLDPEKGKYVNSSIPKDKIFWMMNLKNITPWKINPFVKITPKKFRLKYPSPQEISFEISGRTWCYSSKIPLTSHSRPTHAIYNWALEHWSIFIEGMGTRRRRGGPCWRICLR